MSSDESTNGLPYNQPCIPTSEIQRCMKQINAWWKDGKRTLGPLGIMYGDAGIGKTMAVQNGLLKSEPEQHVQCTFVMVRPAPTWKGMLTSICDQLGLPSRGHSSYDMISKLQDNSKQGPLPLLVFDDADYFLDQEGHLQSSSLEMLSMLLGHPSCFVLFIGTPKLLTGLEIVPRLDCRLGLTHHFHPLSDAEMYEVFLPQLVFPGWIFHSTDPRDLQVGKYLWERTRPSLRHVCTVLEYTSYLVQMRNSKHITFEEISIALKDFWKGHQEPGRGSNNDETI